MRRGRGTSEFPGLHVWTRDTNIWFCGVWRKILLERRIWNSARRQHGFGRAESILCPWNIVAKIDRGSAQRRWISKNLALFRQDAVFKQDKQFSTLPRVESAVVCGFLTQRRVVVCLEFDRRNIFGTVQHFSRLKTNGSARREKKVYNHVFSAWATILWANSRQGLRLSGNFSLNCQFIAHSSVCPWSLDNGQTYNPLFAVILISLRSPMATVLHHLARERVGTALQPRMRRKST